MKVAVLALQGAFEEHENKLNKLGIPFIELRKQDDLKNEFDALILPGGESTVQGKLLHELGMFDNLKQLIDNGMPVLATCAGMILLAGNISNDSHTYFASMPVTVRRNAYGRQLGSFHTEAAFGSIGKIPMTFIRAPYIEQADTGVEVLSEVDGNIVAVRYGRQLALAFHPELDDDDSIYRLFIESIA